MVRPEVKMFWYSSRPITLSVSQLVHLWGIEYIVYRRAVKKVARPEVSEW
jgi:hypothetical protein